MVSPDPRTRRTARDRGLRRAGVATAWAAVGGLTATAVAAAVLAQPATAAPTASDDVPPASVAPATPPDTPALPRATTPAAPGYQRSGGGASTGGSGSVLQPPAQAPRLVHSGGSHASSGAS
jgi:hypothetical protein